MKERIYRREHGLEEALKKTLTREELGDLSSSLERMDVWGTAAHEALAVLRGACDLALGLARPCPRCDQVVGEDDFDSWDEAYRAHLRRCPKAGP